MLNIGGWYNLEVNTQNNEQVGHDALRVLKALARKKPTVKRLSKADGVSTAAERLRASLDGDGVPDPCLQYKAPAPYVHAKLPDGSNRPRRYATDLIGVAGRGDNSSSNILLRRLFYSSWVSCY